MQRCYHGRPKMTLLRYKEPDKGNDIKRKIVCGN